MLAAVAIAGCQSTATPESGTANAARGYPNVDFPELTCASHGVPNGSAAKLTSSRVKVGDPAYIEFRQRLSPAIPSGHLYVVFGRLDKNGEPQTRQYVGLYPRGSVVGLYGGAIIPVPAELRPNIGDCKFASKAAFRVSLSENQYQALLQKVRATLASPPLWHMAAFNCNHFAASLGEAVGLKAPADSLLPSFAYIHALIRANAEGA